MSMENGRYVAPQPPKVAEGWSLERLTPVSRLYGANGLRTGPDGRVYVAQFTGSQISALDLASGRLETISPMGSEIVAPDDMDFDARGELYVTEYMNARVSVIDSDGGSRVLRDDLPGANGITFHRGRLFVDECRMDGRLMELDLAGGAPRVLVDGIPLANALEAGPDGLLYYPALGSNDIWRIHPDGGTPERVAGDLGTPVAVKFDSRGRIVSPQVASGEVLRIDPQSGEREVLASLHPGLDNLTFADGRLLVSNFDGSITEILDGGETRSLLPGGLNWPLDLAVGEDGRLYIADGSNLYVLLPGGKLQSLGMLFTPGYPGFVRGLAALSDGAFAVATSLGTVAIYRPADCESELLAEGLDQPYGVAVAPGGAIVTAELGAGRVLSVEPGRTDVLASGLREPLGVAIGPGGRCWVSEAGAGRVVELKGGKGETVLDGLSKPQGLLARGEVLVVVDAGAKELIEFDLERGERRCIARGLPVGAPPGVTPKPIGGLPPFTGPQGPFAGITAGPDGALYVSADAEGSVLRLQRA